MNELTNQNIDFTITEVEKYLSENKVERKDMAVL